MTILDSTKSDMLRCKYINSFIDTSSSYYDDVDVYRKEFALESGSPKERIRHAAEWLKNAIDTGVVSV